MPQSWKRSRNAALWRRLKPAEAVRVLADCYGDGAGAEVLLRAFLAERDMNRHNVRFWLRVYESLSAPPRDRTAGATGLAHGTEGERRPGSGGLVEDKKGRVRSFCC